LSSRWRRVSQVSREIDGDGDDVWQGGEVWLREGMRLEGMRVPAGPCLSSWACLAWAGLYHSGPMAF
jgi:hypothetical protein